MQRIGLNRVNFGTAPARDVGSDEAEQQAAEARWHKCVKRIERYAPRQPLAGVEPEKNLMHESDGFAHGGNRQAGDCTDYDSQDDDARFPRAHNGTQAVRDFERTAEKAHEKQIQSTEMPMA